MAEAHFSVFLFKRFYLIYILNLSTCLFAFYNAIFSMFHYCFLFIYLFIYYYWEYVDLIGKKGITLTDTL